MPSANTLRKDSVAHKISKLQRQSVNWQRRRCGPALPASNPPSPHFQTCMMLSVAFFLQAKLAAAREKRKANVDRAAEAAAAARPNADAIEVSQLSQGWTALALHPVILRNLARLGFVRPTPIQSMCVLLAFQLVLGDGHQLKTHSRTPEVQLEHAGSCCGDELQPHPGSYDFTLIFTGAFQLQSVIARTSSGQHKRAPAKPSHLVFPSSTRCSAFTRKSRSKGAAASSPPANKVAKNQALKPRVRGHVRTALALMWQAQQASVTTRMTRLAIPRQLLNPKLMGLAAWWSQMQTARDCLPSSSARRASFLCRCSARPKVAFVSAEIGFGTSDQDLSFLNVPELDQSAHCRDFVWNSRELCRHCWWNVQAKAAAIASPAS